MRNTRLIALFAVLLLALGSIAMVGCGGGDDSTTGGGGGGSTSEASGGEPLTVGSDIPYPPFEQGKPGNYTGFDIELLEAVGESIGREVEFEDTSFDTIFLDLGRGNFDVVASAATITDEREKTVDFTNPYYISEQAILVKEGSDIDSVEKLAGETIGVQQGTTGQEFVEEEGEAGDLRKYPQGPDAVNALQNGTVDAVVIDIPVAENAENAGNGVEISAAIPTEEEYGFAVKQGDTELLEELNEGLKEVIDNGTYAKLYEQWFKHTPPKEIETATHEAS